MELTFYLQVWVGKIVSIFYINQAKLVNYLDGRSR